MLNNSVTILNVGHGNCTVINCNGEHSIVDAGSKSAVLSFLKKNTITEINTLFLSHADSDHIEGAIALLADEDIRIHNIGLNTDSIKTSVLWDDLLHVIDDQHRRRQLKPNLSVIESNTYSLADSTIKIISPSVYLAAKGPGSMTSANSKIDSNSISLFIVLEHSGENVICIPGDLDELGYSHIPEELKNTLSCSYLVFPHHGGKCKGNYLDYYRKLLDDVRPTTILFSNGRGRFGNPRQDILDLIQSWNKKTCILCTQLSENCSAEIPIQNQDIFNRLEARQCAGNITILFGEKKGIIQPDMDCFTEFKSTLLESKCKFV